MKLKLAIIVVLLLCVTSCYSPESVADKALNEIGDGKYRFNTDKIFMGVNDEIFSMALVNNAEAEDFLQGKRQYDGYKDLFFQTTNVFGNWELVDKLEFQMDLLNADLRESAKLSGHENWWDDHKETITLLYDSIGGEYDGKQLVYLSDDAIITKHKAISITRLRYKIDNSCIAIIDLIKTDKGYRVASFIWEK